jgi:succinate dehydrogenase/fumarate reductase cytochrome b subunit
MAAAFGSLPVAAKVGIKSLIAWPFAYHSINGVRHLVWDTGAGIPFFEMAINHSFEQPNCYPNGNDCIWT